MLSWGAPSHLPPVLGLLIVRESHVPACDVAGATCACQWHSQWWEGENSSPACRGLAHRGFCLSATQLSCGSRLRVEPPKEMVL